MAVLAVENLKTHFFTKAGVVKAVDDVSFSVDAGRVLGLVGESGSGKTVTGFSIMGLVDPPGRIVAGRILLEGHNLLDRTDDAMRGLRGDRIAMIFQDPMMTLNPVLRIDTQMIETVLAHQAVSKEQAHELSRNALGRVGIPSPDERLKAYPHQLSGGMRQRVAIAIALLNNPRVIIADEPTTALDVTVQAQILEVLGTALEETGAAMVLITHDLGVVAGVADRVLVMYAGKPVEIGSVEDIYYEPRMPYTLGLLGSLPRLDSTGRERLTPIVGSPPSLVNMPPGCPFAPRCPLHIAECDAGEPPLFDVGRGHSAACIRTEIVEKAHGDATFVFDETSADMLLTGEASPLEDDIPAGDRDRGPSAEVEGETAPDHAAGETGSIVSPKGTNS